MTESNLKRARTEQSTLVEMLKKENNKKDVSNDEETNKDLTALSNTEPLKDVIEIVDESKDEDGGNKVVLNHDQSLKRWTKLNSLLINPVPLKEDIEVCFINNNTTNNNYQLIIREMISGNESACLICYDCEKVTFKYSNVIEHLQSHGDNFQYTFKNIMNGVTVKLIKKSTDPKFENDTSCVEEKVEESCIEEETLQKETDLVKEFEFAAVKFLICGGNSIDRLQHFSFYELLSIARNMSFRDDYNISSEKVKDLILKQHQKYQYELGELISRCKAFSIVFDGCGWGEDHNFLGASLQAVILNNNGRLSLIKAPFMFAYLAHPLEIFGKKKYYGYENSDVILTGNFMDPEVTSKFHKIEDIDDIIRLISSKLKSIGLVDPKRPDKFPKLICVKGEGNPNATGTGSKVSQCTVLLSRIGMERECKSVVHSCDLAMKHVLRKVTSLGENQIPESINDLTRDFFDKVRFVIGEFRRPRVWDDFLKFCDVNKPVPMYLDTPDRWLSTYEMMISLQENHRQIAQFYKKDSRISRSYPQILEHLQDMIAIFKPVVEFTKFCQNTDKQISPFILPLILVLLDFYGVEVKKDGLLDPLSTFTRVDTDTLHRDFIPIDGGGFKPFKRFSEVAKSFAATIAEHLHFRLVKTRVNANAIDLLATYCDPLANKMFRLICGPRKYAEKMEALLDSFSTKPPVDTDNIPQSINSRLDVPLETDIEGILFEQEPNPFMQMDDCGKYRLCYNFYSCLKEFEKHDPLLFWSNQVNQVKYEKRFECNMRLLSVMQSSFLKEPMFPSARAMLLSNRDLFLQDPQLFESVLILRYKYNLENSV